MGRGGGGTTKEGDLEETIDRLIWVASPKWFTVGSPRARQFPVAGLSLWGQQRAERGTYLLASGGTLRFPGQFETSCDDREDNYDM